MYKNGIIAVGDICNTNYTLNAKLKSKIHYYNFIESFALNPNKTNHAFEKATKLLIEFKSKLKFPASITPHAPYSVSDKLFELINKNLLEKDLLTIHNQESESENEFFKTKSGALAQRLIDWGIDLSHIKANGTSSLLAYIQKLHVNNKLLLVHNTFTSSNDIDSLNLLRKHTYWALCPNANLFIEDALPDIQLLKESGIPICIGTDSLASNHDLNIWSEIKTIQQHVPQISTGELIKWACINGATFFGIDNKFGSIEKGKTPGIINVCDDCVKLIA